MNPTGGDWRDHSSGVSNQQHARSGDRMHDASARNHSCPTETGRNPRTSNIGAIFSRNAAITAFSMN